MKEVAIEGLDGAGKTSVAHELAIQYAQDGARAVVVAPYRLAQERVGEDLYSLWKSNRDALVAIHAVQSVMHEARDQAVIEGADLLIYDRHWMTAFTEIAARPNLVKAWGDYFVPTAYLQIGPETASRRSTNDEAAAWMQPDMLTGYATKYELLCKEFGQYLLGIYRNDDDVELAAIARSIAWDLNIRR